MLKYSVSSPFNFSSLFAGGIFKSFMSCALFNILNFLRAHFAFQQVISSTECHSRLFLFPYPQISLIINNDFQLKLKVNIYFGVEKILGVFGFDFLKIVVLYCSEIKLQLLFYTGGLAWACK
jgi:hypothetical protein